MADQHQHQTDSRLGEGLPACSCRHPGPLAQELLATGPDGETFRFTCPGCGKTRNIEIRRGARMPRFLP